MMLSFTAPLPPDAVQFLSEETRIDFSLQDMRHWFCVTAWGDHGAVIGALACEPKTSFDWHFSCAIADPRLMSRRLLRTIFRTLFSRAVRVTAMIDPSNERALRQVRRLGFKFEGFCRLGIEGVRDAEVYGMLPWECPWLAHPTRHARHGDVLGLGHPPDVPGVDATELPRVASVPGNGLLGRW